MPEFVTVGLAEKALSNEPAGPGHRHAAVTSVLFTLDVEEAHLVRANVDNGPSVKLWPLPLRHNDGAGGGAVHSDLAWRRYW